MNREEAINIVRNIYQTDKEKEALAMLVPELAGSDEERIRKGLIEALKTSKTVGELKFVLPEPTREECIDYLEKLKEQKPISQEDFDAAKHEALWDDQKPVKVGENAYFDPNTDTYFIKDKQKPERINVAEMVAKYRVTDEYVEGEYKGKPVNCMIRAYEQGIRDTLLKMKEQKPAWSEDFDNEVEKIHKRYPEVSFAKLTRIAYHFSKWANNYKCMKWSDEDEKMLNDILGILHSTEDAAMANFSEQKNWLKSRHTSWKPGKEQLEALGIAMYRNDSIGYNLRQLYEQLKKL